MSRPPGGNAFAGEVAAAGPAAAPTQDVADRVVAAVRAVPGVADLHSGPFGEVATHLPGRRVQGVQVRNNRCSVHIVLLWDNPVLATADRVRAAVTPLVRTPVDVRIEDVVLSSTTP